jgi:hypothetical protein
MYIHTYKSDDRLPSPAHLRTLLLTLGGKRPYDGGSGSNSGTSSSHRVALANAILEELRAWGQVCVSSENCHLHKYTSSQLSPPFSNTPKKRKADTYLELASSPIPTARQQQSPAGGGGLRSALRLSYVPRPQRGFTLAMWFFLEEVRDGGLMSWRFWSGIPK